MVSIIHNSTDEYQELGFTKTPTYELIVEYMNIVGAIALMGIDINNFYVVFFLNCFISIDFIFSLYKVKKSFFSLSY